MIPTESELLREHIKQSMVLLDAFCEAAYTPPEIEYELRSLRKFYRIKLSELKEAE